jgi:4-amino-4-deoxy-L-arabinose transferase-like glycosyltransferase
MAKIISLITKHKLLIAILLIASFLRLWKLGEVPVSLFGDELDVGYHAYSVLKTGKDYSGNSLPLHFQSLAEWRTPLYLYSVVPTVALFGISSLGVRLPAAIFGILGVYGAYLLVGELGRFGRLGKLRDSKNQMLAIIATAIMAFSPWHIQYSRAAFEVTQLLAFLIFGLYFFFRSLKKGKWLWVSVALLTFTPWIYSTAKLYTPLLLVILFLAWKKELLSLSRKHLVKATIAGLVVGLPVAYSTLFAGGSQRFGYISVFTDPTRETEIGAAREFDARVRGEIYEGLQPSVSDKFFHNKIAFWLENISENIFKSYSPDFLFVKGDPNLRHSIEGVGQFYMIEAIALIFGLIFFFTSKADHRIKTLIIFWVLAGVLPAAITRNGGNHATRLILILPPLVFLISFGLIETYRKLNGVSRLLFTVFYTSLFLLEFVFYQHYFWVHNPMYSERWWHAGWEEATRSIKEVEANYEQIVISTANEPPWVFFAAWYQYPPAKWHEEFPIGNDINLAGFGRVSHIDKYYFGTPQTDESFYSWDQILDDKTLYLADTKEVNVNLIREPERTPPGLRLVKAIPFPSGEPAFYLFSGQAK